VIRTRVGYSGGTTRNPTYRNLGDHTETVQIDYDPSRTSYEELLAVFWDSHNPGMRAWSRQYLTAVFFHNEEQRRLALETRDRVAAKIKGEVVTQILPASDFYLAEAYHQKFYLRQVPELLKEVTMTYPAVEDFVGSTAAARLNGYLAGYGTPAGLKAELSSLGLSPAGSQNLLEMVSASERSGPTQICPIPK
jgi:methionine-S-sulfoxide reductase